MAFIKKCEGQVITCSSCGNGGAVWRDDKWYCDSCALKLDARDKNEKKEE